MSTPVHPPSVTSEDIAEEIVWAAARPPHVQIAEVLVFPTNQAMLTIHRADGKAE
jgi:3-hydroxy acid dehydrogenase/malonic semialdehyde reductase